MEVQITEGVVPVSYVDVLLKTPDFVILEIGTAETRPMMFSYTPGRSVRLTRIGLYDSPVNLTEIQFHFDRGGSHWDQVVEISGRYAVQVITWRRPEPSGIVTIYQGRRDNGAVPRERGRPSAGD